MFEIIDNLPKWAKILGISSAAGILVLLLVLIYISNQPGSSQAVNAPTTIENARENATNTLISAGINASQESSQGIIDSFHQAGESLASTVKDPATKATVIGGMTFAGFLLALFVVLAIIGAILGALGIKAPWMK